MQQSSFERLKSFTINSPDEVDLAFSLRDKDVLFHNTLHRLDQYCGDPFLDFPDRILVQPKDLIHQSPLEGVGLPNPDTEFVANWLLEAIEGVLDRYYENLEDPLKWGMSGPNLRRRLAIESLIVSGYIEKYEDGLISKKALIEAVRNYEPEKWDYYNSKALLPEEIPALQKRFGLAVAEKSLAPDSEAAKELRKMKEQLRTFFLLQTTEQLLDIASVREKFPVEHRLALDLYKCFHAAVRQLVGESALRAPEDIIDQAYRLFVLQGKDESRKLLETYRFRKTQIERMLEDFALHKDVYQGNRCGVSTSRFEQNIEEVFKERGMFYQRQVAYASLLDKSGQPILSGKFRSDFVLPGEGDSLGVIVEIIDEEDPFIHSQVYWDRLKVNETAARNAGYDFMVISPFDRYQQIVDDLASINSRPGESLRFVSERIEHLKDRGRAVRSDVAPAEDRRRLYFYGDPYKQAYARKRLVG